MEYLIRLVHVHESFRKHEIEALAVLAGVNLEILSYSKSTPFLIIRLENEQAARALIARAILSFSIYELWGMGPDYESLHANVTANNAIQPTKYKDASFRFTMDTFQMKRPTAEQRMIIDSFRYLPFDGPIKMNDAELQMCIFEEFETKGLAPKALYLGRWIADGNRDAIVKYSLKRRKYISRTSMDAELSLVTANLVLAAPGKIVYDPFVGTGSFSVACAHFGASALGSDIDGRSVRGSDGVNVQSNFSQYGITSNFLDNFIADLTHTPLRTCRMMDGIICDPPYGVREGPKVLGSRPGKTPQIVIIDGVPAHMHFDYIPPRRPYGFDDMMMDVLEFSFEMLVDHGRLCMWMPTANDADAELAIPMHYGLQLISTCVQHFNKWSRRLLTYQRLPDASLPRMEAQEKRERAIGTADDLNRFRKQYFDGFKTPMVDLPKS